MFILFFLLLFSQNAFSNDLDISTPTEADIKPNETVVNEPTEMPVTQAASEPEKEPEFQTGKLELLDKIEAEIVTSTPDSIDTQIITTSDIRKRAFDGGKYTLDDLINEALADNLGKVFKINLTDDDVNKYLKRANLTDKKQLKKLTEQWGYESLEEFYENFKKIYRANSALNYEMSSQLVVTEEEIQEDYKNNPVYKEGYFTIETTFVLLDSTKTKDELRQELEDFVNGKRDLDYIIWDMPITVKKTEIPKANNFLENMPPQSIYIKELNDGFDLFKLIDKKDDYLVPLEENKKERIDKLQTKKQEEVYKKVNENLHSKAIIYKPDQTTPENISELGL